LTNSTKSAVEKQYCQQTNQAVYLYLFSRYGVHQIEIKEKFDKTCKVVWAGSP